MTDIPESQAADEAVLKSAGTRLNAALARLESGLGRLAARAAEGGQAQAVEKAAAPDRAREEALEAALKEASGTMGALIAEVRGAIEAAEAAADEASGGASDGIAGDSAPEAGHGER